MINYLMSDSTKPDSSSIAILGISAKTINELDAYGITLNSFTDDSMTFNWNQSIQQRMTERYKMFVKKKVGHQCRVSYIPESGVPELMILRRKYIT
jgi:hypothetical protein